MYLSIKSARLHKAKSAASKYPCHFLVTRATERHFRRESDIVYYEYHDIQFSVLADVRNVQGLYHLVLHLVEVQARY